MKRLRRKRTSGLAQKSALTVRLGISDGHVLFVAVNDEGKQLFSIPFTPEEAMLIGENLQSGARQIKAGSTGIAFSTIGCNGCNLQAVVLNEEEQPPGWHDGYCPTCAHSPTV